MTKFINGVPVVSLASLVLPDSPKNAHLIRAREYSEKAGALVTKTNIELERGGALTGPRIK